MKDFDISSILAFEPPNYICPACRGIYLHVSVRREKKGEKTEYIESCPVCKVRYVFPSWEDKPPSIQRMLGLGGYRIEEGDMLAHAKSLAKIIESSKGKRIVGEPKPWPTMRLLLEMLSRAKLFVHFTSWGISHVLIGALKATSMHVPVYGSASNVESHAKVELTDFPDEAPNLKVSVIPSSQGIYDAPHQKLVIIDGLVAFKGSTNLTNAGMRRADRALDVSEVETNVAKVADINNRYFAPVWKRLNAPSDTFEMDWPPF
jgi:hypothetical protein